MLNDKQTERMLSKLVRLEKTLEPYIFTNIGDVAVKRFETLDQYHNVPQQDQDYIRTNIGDKWGSEGSYCWFRGKVYIPDEYKGQNIYVRPNVGGYEAMLWVNGVPCGTFATKIVQTGHGNHYCDLLVKAAQSYKEIDLAIEFYAGHYIIGTQPFETNIKSDFRYTFDSINLCIKNQDIADFIFDLRTLNQMANKLDKLSFRRADIINNLVEVHKVVYYAVEDTEEEIWRPALLKARGIMKPILEAKNSASAPSAGIVGHSHMDTAWLWHIPETVKKCARTFSNEISLMDQYPEYKFIQSSSYHSEMIRKNYPGLFAKIKEKVAEGRYEPNGAVWVECDCNIPSGESMIRQFLWGQRYTQKHFNYTSNCFWLPDTFGYSAAIPQIMKGCMVDYFLTTKISWNDTNKFPYDTFYWKGIDDTPVFTHFNTTHCWPDPKTLLEQIDGRDSENYIQNKQVVKKRLMAYGYGDGGGGPQFEMIEMARRVKDLEGCPKAEHVNVGKFMKELEKEAIDPPVFKGELYLELHRGTLTNQHVIKHNNRKAEFALRDLEFLTVQRAVNEEKAAEDRDIRPLMETLLVNQFHDILPGTCIARVNDQCYSEMNSLLLKAKTLTDDIILTEDDKNCITVINTLPFEREEIIYIDGFLESIPANNNLLVQKVEDIHGNEKLCLGQVKLPSLGGAIIELKPLIEVITPETSPFSYCQNILTTPFAKITFAEDGTIVSFLDTRVNRELRGKGLPLNSFIMAEDVPASWDSWDLDADCQMKFIPCSKLINRRVVSDGSIQYRIRSTYAISDKSQIVQDMVFYSTTPRVDFETIIDWKDKHRFLKVDFNTTVMSNTARHEIQFGHTQKPTIRNNSLEQAMFEVVNHKFTDLSETRFGVSILNDCKYGISVEGTDIRLSLHKGGCRPDPRGDEGVHECVYSFLPHIGDFSSENVVKPAYCLNVMPIIKPGRGNYESFAKVSENNIIIESIKPCEDNQKAFIMRLYEAEGTFTHSEIKLGIEYKSAEITNMLEETLEVLPGKPEIQLIFKPFEIKTIKIIY
ncbi:MAG TPA: glycoside hydrolase family 38 C-terminal domain-containing protein [Ruminiclostridium sp.]